MNVVDSHAHLGDEVLFAEVDLIVERAQKVGVSHIFNICTDEVTLQRGLELNKKYPWIHNVGGVHPHDAGTRGHELFSLFSESAKQGELVAIGETGLDYYYNHSDKASQREQLEQHLAFALDCGLPVVIHCRDAFEDLFAIADSCYKSERLLLHCFTGSEKEAYEVLDRGWMLSFSGIVTFKKSIFLREVARKAPADRILIETDAPYLAPQSKRGKTNEPSFVCETLQMLAHVRNVAPELLADTTAANALSFFQVSS